MSTEREQAIRYLRSPENAPWGWAEDGGVLTWRDGTTIAFREEIVRIIEWLRPTGLPPFGCIVLLLAACRGKVPAIDELVRITNARIVLGAKDPASPPREVIIGMLEDAVAQLARVSELPSELRSNLHAKCVLTEAIFEVADKERFVDGSEVLAGMKEPITEAELNDHRLEFAGHLLIRPIHMLSQGLVSHPAESLALRLRTGLDALPKPVDLNLPLAQRARLMIEELSKDRELGTVARAARELMAAVRLPRRLGEREQLAIGGVADITNRGPLDRLLLSELAHDDLTLSVRVALNEALYLRREPPLREPPGTLALLLDSGVRLWGVPRVLATAVALAFVACDKQHNEVLAWQAQGKNLRPLDLLTREGLLSHLASLEPTVHPGGALPAFAEALSGKEHHQSVLITHPDAMGDPEFRHALSKNPDAAGFVATVDREGRFELHALPLARRPAICESDLDLASILEPPTASSPIRPELDPNLPAIFGMRPFPFLLPLSGKVDCWTRSPGFVYATLNDRRLVSYRGRTSGGRVLASDLPSGKPVWMEATETEVHAVKAGASQRPWRLLSCPLEGGPLRVADLVSGPEVQAVHRYGNAIVLIRAYDVRAHALSDGRLLGQVRNPHIWVHGRFLRGNNQFYFAVWDGERVKFEPVSLPSGYAAFDVAKMFDREGHPGPWVLSSRRELVCTETGQAQQLPMLFDETAMAAARFSRDGNQMVLPSATSTHRRPFLWSLELNKQIPLPDLTDWTLDQAPPLPCGNTYRTIEAIGRWKGVMALLGRKGRWNTLALEPSGIIRIKHLPAGTDIASDLIFDGPPRATKQGCTLKVAKHPSGSEVFLDSRGLLHFRSYGSELAQVSLVLSDREVAGWTSDGYVCGPAFFFAGRCTSAPSRVYERLMRFFEKL